MDLRGTGFDAECVVHLARWTAAHEWEYFAAELPVTISASRLTIPIGDLTPGDYVAVIRAAEGSVSAPMAFTIGGLAGQAYTMPVGRGEQWVVTQRPSGGFSHFNRSRNAWDIAPTQGRYVTAMRAGIVHAHDLGLGRTPRVHSFGNYITIDHGDGEYSHYAHLATQSFLVRDGDRVSQGQSLAAVGNSGYTLGAGGGYHVHVHVTRSASIAAQSIPFEFDQIRTVRAQGPGKLSGTVQVGLWWTDLVVVGGGTPQLQMTIELQTPATEVALHMVSPSGIHYAVEGLKFLQSKPEIGLWRIAIEGMRGGIEPIAFLVDTEVRKAKAPSD